MSENIPNLENVGTKTKCALEKINYILKKENNESILNSKLALRKKKVFNYIMEKRIKNEEKNNNNKINSKQKLYEYKKLFEIEKIRETIDKLILNCNMNYIKNKKIIELIHLYSQHLISNDNVKDIFEKNLDKIIGIFLNEIIADINSLSINFELFDYYLIILGNIFVYKKSVYDNSKNEYLSLFLNIINKNSNLEKYSEYNFNIINDSLWIVYLYISFSDKQNISFTFPYIMKTVNNLFTNKFFEELKIFNAKSTKENINLIIIKEIIHCSINIYLSILESILGLDSEKINNINIQKEDLQHCLDISLQIYEFNELKDIFIGEITYIMSLILDLSKNIYILSLDKFYNIYISLIEQYKNYDYDKNKISENLICILYYLLDNYYEENRFYEILKTTDIIKICIQYYLKNGSIINIVLKTLNMIFKYPMYYHKIIIISINYKLIDYVCEIILNTENNQSIFYECLNILINAYIFLENNMKNPNDANISKYFNMKIIPKFEKLMLNDNKDICELASFLYKKFKNIEN